MEISRDQLRRANPVPIFFMYDSIVCYLQYRDLLDSALTRLTSIILWSLLIKKQYNQTRFDLKYMIKCLAKERNITCATYSLTYWDLAQTQIEMGRRRWTNGLLQGWF